MATRSFRLWGAALCKQRNTREIVKRLEILHNTFPRIFKDTVWLTTEQPTASKKAGGHFSQTLSDNFSSAFPQSKTDLNLLCEVWDAEW